MSDIRSLNLMGSTIESLSSIQESSFGLSDAQLDVLQNKMQTLRDLPYWSAEYQAWEPFLLTYLRSGANVKLAEQWASVFGNKPEQLTVPPNAWSEVYSEVLKLNRRKSTECFSGIYWREVEGLVQRIPVLLDMEKELVSILSNVWDVKSYLDTMTSTDVQNGYSIYLPYAIYLYRHCMAEEFELLADNKKVLDAQLNSYVGEFEKHFDEVSNFVHVGSSDPYLWYSDEIKELISNAWRTGTDVSDSRRVIPREVVGGMPVWLSESITEYLNDLPCVLDLSISQEFVFDTVMYAVSGNTSPLDKASYLAYCLSRWNIRKLMDNLREFYWDIRYNKLVPTLIAKYTVQYTTSNDGSMMSPQDYELDLVRRGFPINRGG